MQRTEYLLLATALHKCRPDPMNASYEGWRLAAEAIARALADRTRAFDRERFLDNCETGVTHDS